MGNGLFASKKNNKFDNFGQMMDYIATHYILTMDFDSMSKLASEPKYCDELVIITSDIIKKHFNDLDIKYLAQRIRDGEEIPDGGDMTKERISFISKTELEDLDIKNGVNKSIRKKRVCIGIANFYIKIAHIFAAILTTINPVYIYTDASGNEIKKGLLEKKDIPINVKITELKTNICDNRIKGLTPLEKVEKVGNIGNIGNNGNNIYINPKVCELNLDSSGNQMNLSDEPGMTELKMLYMDDEYDYSDGTFKGMSDKMKSEYKKDLKTFYTAFTGETDVPEGIDEFSKIKLRTYNKTDRCQQQPENMLKTGTMVSKKDELFKKYAENLNIMIYHAQSNQQKLLSVINKLFVFTPQPYGNGQKIRVNPSLTSEILDSLINETRNMIIKLYVTCENDFAKGIQLYEAIVEKNILETSKSQINNLVMKQQILLMQPPVEVKPVEVKPPPEVKPPVEVKPQEGEQKPAEVKPAVEVKPPEGEQKPAEVKPAEPVKQEGELVKLVEPVKQEGEQKPDEVKPAVAEVKQEGEQVKPPEGEVKPAEGEVKPAVAEVKPAVEGEVKQEGEPVKPPEGEPVKPAVAEVKQEGESS